MDHRERERQTIRALIGIFCRGNHPSAVALCGECRDLLDYAEKRLARCPHAEKPACKDCDIHCYTPEIRKAIQAVMRYAGPRMILRDPVAAVNHLLRKRPAKKGKGV